MTKRGGGFGIAGGGFAVGTGLGDRVAGVAASGDLAPRFVGLGRSSTRSTSGDLPRSCLLTGDLLRDLLALASLSILHGGRSANLSTLAARSANSERVKAVLQVFRVYSAIELPYRPI